MSGKQVAVYAVLAYELHSKVGNMNIYVELTRSFNQGRVRAILAGGQAVVLHRMAIMSKDGDWVLREDEEALAHIRTVLAEYGARYRFGAPLDVRWLAGGWSSHFEFQNQGIRVRTDFVTRPPRLDEQAVDRLWRHQEDQAVPAMGVRELAETKKTNREKDYAVIGELARLMTDPNDQMLYSRSARDLMDLAEKHPDRAATLARKRPALVAIQQGISKLEAALDAERRQLIHANEERLAKYMAAAERWADAWPRVAREIEGRSLLEAHGMVVARAEGTLPFPLPGGPS